MKDFLKEISKMLDRALDSEETDEYIYKTEPSEIEEFCLILFTMIVGFVFGFIVGVSY